MCAVLVATAGVEDAVVIGAEDAAMVKLAEAVGDSVELVDEMGMLKSAAMVTAEARGAVVVATGTVVASGASDCPWTSITSSSMNTTGWSTHGGMFSLSSAKVIVRVTQRRRFGSRSRAVEAVRFPRLREEGATMALFVMAVRDIGRGRRW